MKVIVSLSTIVLMLCLMISQAWAQQGVITLDDTVIKGRIQKPEAFYILQNDKLNYEGVTLPPSFIEELKESVEEEPF